MIRTKSDTTTIGPRKVAILVYALLMLVFYIPIFQNLGSYWQYRGVAELPIQTAMLLELEKGTEDITITAYNESGDTILVTFDFWGTEEDGVKYNIPGQKNTFWYLATYGIPTIWVLLTIIVIALWLPIILALFRGRRVIL